MRKILAIVFCAFALISCERYIEINPAGPKRELVLNALIASSDTTHYISVSVSRKDAIEYPRVVTLKSYVNDIPSDEVTVSGFSKSEHKIPFKASISTGDRMRIEVVTDTLSASASASVSSAPVLKLLETSSFTELSDEGNEENYVYVKANIQDIIGEANCYTLVAYQDVSWVVELSGSDEVSVGDTLRVTRRLLSTDNSLDPMLHKEVAIGNNTLISNTFNLFTDEGFPDGACDITLLIKNPFTGEQQERRDGGSTIAVPHYDLYLRVLNISTETFRYYSCLSDQYTLIGDTYLVDYPSFPSNVDGGLGYVSAGGADEVFLGSKAARMVLPWM